MNKAICFLFACCFSFLFITEGKAQQKGDFNSPDHDTAAIDSLIQRYQDEGMDFKMAREKAFFEILDNDVTLRYLTHTYEIKPKILPGVPTDKPVPGSIKVNRDAKLKNYNPTELVREVLLKSFKESDKQRIQNVRLFGVGGDGTPNAPGWISSDSADIVPPLEADRVWQSTQDKHHRSPLPGDRSLAYFEGDDGGRFPLKKGLVLSTAGTYAVEGPNEDFRALSIGVNHKGEWAGKTAKYARQLTKAEPDANMFDVDATNTIRQVQPWGNSTYGAVLEFDFKPADEEVKFDFIFGSEEYSEAVHDQYNDVFGFYVSGPFDEMPDGSPKVDYGTPNLTEAIEKRPLTDKAYTATTRTSTKVLNTVDTFTTTNGKKIKQYVRYNIAELPNGDPVGVNSVNWGFRSFGYPDIHNYAHWGVSPSTYRYPDLLPFDIHPDTMGFVTNMLPSFRATFPIDSPQLRVVDIDPNKRTPTTAEKERKSRGVNMAYFRPIMEGDPLVEMNGLTIVLEAKADSLVPEKWYHLKIVVAQADFNHGDVVFLSNLDLGVSVGKLTDLPKKPGEGWDSSWDTIYGGVGVVDMPLHGHRIPLYNNCPRILDVTLQTTAKEPIIDFKFNDLVRDYLDITYEGKPVKETIFLKKGQKNYRLHITPKDLPVEMNGKIGMITSSIRGTATKDTILKYTAYNHPKTKVRYKAQTPNYRGQLEFDITGGTPYLFASVNQGRTWFSTSKETPRSELRDLPDTFNIWLREPNSSCDDIIIPIIKGYGVTNIVRTIELPTFSNATTTPHAGLWEVESRGDFVFNLTPTEENRDKTPVISTDRQLFDDLKNPPVVTKNNDGSYTVTIKEVTEDFKVSVDFPLITSISEEIRPQVWTSRSQLYVHALEQQQVKVYTLQGMLTKAFELVPGETRCTTLPDGIYLIRLGSNNKTYKVVINE